MVKLDKKIICFDLDGVICRTVKKNIFLLNKSKAIEKINSLSRKGFYIKIFTTRFMGRNQENVKKAKKQGYKKTLNQLKNWNLKFDKLILENPHMIYLLMINQCFLKRLVF